MSTALPTHDDLRRWRLERERFAKEEEAARLRRLALERLIEAGEAFLGIVKDDALQPAPSVMPPQLEAERRTAGRPKRLSGSPESWTSTILRIVNEANRGLTYDDLRAALAQTHLGPKLRQTDKGFYGGIGKLAKAEKVVRYKGRIYSPEAFRRFMADVKAGVVEDAEPPSQQRTSPARDAILRFLAERGAAGASSVSIFAELEKMPEFAESFARSRAGKTTIYNLLARMFRRGEIAKDGSGVYRLPVQTKEPPPRAGDDGSKPDGVAAPSMETQTDLVGLLG